MKKKTPEKSPSPLMGLVPRKTANSLPGKIALQLTLLGAHLGRIPVRSAHLFPSPLMCSSLSGERQNSSIINHQNIMTQLVFLLYSVACILKNGGRVLVLDCNQEKNWSAPFLLQCAGATQNGGGRVCGAGFIVNRGEWKAGNCSNWSQISRRVWNWEHSQRFFKNTFLGPGWGTEKTPQDGGFLSEINPWLQRKKESFQTCSLLEGGILCTQERKPLPVSRTGLSFIPKQKSIRMHWTKKPDCILVLGGEKDFSLISEAQALKVPLVYLANTDFNHIHYKFIPQRHALNNGAYPFIANSDSFSFHFLISFLLTQCTLSPE